VGSGSGFFVVGGGALLEKGIDREACATLAQKRKEGCRARGSAIADSYEGVFVCEVRAVLGQKLSVRLPDGHRFADLFGIWKQPQLEHHGGRREAHKFIDVAQICLHLDSMERHTEIFVCALLLYLLLENRRAMAKSDFSCVETRFIFEVATALRFSKRKSRSCAQT